MGILSDKAKQPAGLLSPARMATRPLTGGLLAQMQALPPDEVQRAYLFPWGRVNGQLQAMVPGAVMDAYNAFALPGRVYRGEQQIYDENGRVRDEVIKGATDLAGMVTLGSGAIPAKAGEMRAGIKAYHGSPHDFDRFDMSKIGTGEGAQDLGRGFYFYDDAIAAELYRNPAARWGDLSAMGRFAKEGGGKVYEVNIDASPSQFLDVDSPAAALKPGSRLAAARDMKIVKENDPVYAETMRNSMKVRHVIGDDNTAAAEDGFKGLSRKRYGGETEMVVFDDRLISIVRKYGIAAAIAMGLVSQEDAQRMKEQGLVDG